LLVTCSSRDHHTFPNTLQCRDMDYIHATEKPFAAPKKEITFRATNRRSIDVWYTYVAPAHQ
jgi:hypothetical protein